MKALLFAAGLGTRIQKISKGKPKALVELNGKTLLERAVDYLSNNGISELIVNIHHQADMMEEFISSQDFPIPVHISDERAQLLDTGGGLLKARHFFEGEENFLVYNVDVLSDINIEELIIQHKENKALATLAVRNRSTSRYLLFNLNNKMIGWENINTKERILHKDDVYKQLAFSGVHILSTKIFKLLDQRPNKAFSITKSYIELSEKNKILAFLHDDGYWFDVGKPDSYKAASEFLMKKK